jgi:hypothetical protein
MSGRKEPLVPLRSLIARRGLPVACPWPARGLPVACPWPARGLPMTCPLPVLSQRSGAFYGKIRATFLRHTKKIHEATAREHGHPHGQAFPPSNDSLPRSHTHTPLPLSLPVTPFSLPWHLNPSPSFSRELTSLRQFIPLLFRTRTHCCTMVPSLLQLLHHLTH